MRQQLLENKELDLQTVFDQARSIDTALKSADYYQTDTLASINPHEVQEKSVSLQEDEKIETKDVSARSAKSCSYCGGFFTHATDVRPGILPVMNNRKRDIFTVLVAQTRVQ